MSLTRKMEESKRIEPGTYGVTCIGVRADTIPNSQYGDGSVIKFNLAFDDMVDDDGHPITREKMVGDYLTPGSKLTAILKAFGVMANVGDEVDMEDCINRPALAVVGEKVKGDKTYDTIEDIVAAPKGRPAAPSQTAERPTTAVVNPDGSPNHDAFWRAINALGLTRKHVFDKAGGMDAFTAMDGADIGFLLEELKLQVEAAP